MTTINILADTNKENYNYLKTVEELTELAEVIMKRVLKEKTDKNPPDSAIIEEIGDVELRLLILKSMMNCHVEVNDRVQYKKDKYSEYLEKGLYKGTI